MLRLALSRLSSTPVLRRSLPQLLCPAFSTPIRHYPASDPRDVNPVALHTINYAIGLARSQKSDESYTEALLVLEQCLGSQSQEGLDDAIENSKGVILLAISTLLSERGSPDEAIQTLLKIKDSTTCSLGVRVAAVEALVGLNLELGLDETSSVLADNGLGLLEKEGSKIRDKSRFKGLDVRAKALKGLVQLVQGDLDSAGTFFQGSEGEGCPGNVALSYGELLHAKRDFAAAKELYQRVISGTTGNVTAACNMVSEEVLLAATCALGQLESHLGNFVDAEDTLTKALKHAETHFGSRHPKVGIVLTCIALMYKHKAQSERSSSLLLQEGLYRKAIELLKAPPLESDVLSRVTVEKGDLVALARGGYAEALCVQENRIPEGERMKKWASAAWKNRRLSLAEALDISDEPSLKVPVIDTRICRAL